MNKKQRAFVLVCVLIVTALFANALYSAYQQEKEEEGKVTIMATFYPLEYFAREIGGEYVSVETLIPYNQEVHAWQPSTSDIVSADDKDILLYNGAGLDIWFEDEILPVIKKSDKIIVETTSGIHLLDSDNETEASEGAHDDDEGEGHDHDDEHGPDHEHGLYDPHTWLSPYLAKQQAENIYDAIVKEDPEHEEYYTERWNDLKLRFDQLDNDYRNGLENKTKNEIITTHGAYGYLSDRYGFEQHGVIGISADEQPSTSTIAELVELMIDHDIYIIFVDPVYSDDYAQTLKNELKIQTGEDVRILKLYFMLGPIDSLDYFEQQEANLANLKIGLEAD